MARRGREFEKLVAHLETILSGTEIEIRSPDRIMDIRTGKKREIDISLKTTVGTHQILIILECRERKSKQDILWIEQLASKRDGVKASKVVAICSKGFSQSAIDTAKFLNVELRSIDTLKMEDIRNWFRASHITFFNRLYNLIAVNLKLEDDSAKFPQIDLRKDAEILRDSNNTPLTFMTLAKNMVFQNPQIFDGIIPNNERITRWIQVNTDKPIELIIEGTSYQIIRFDFCLELWIEASQINPSKIVQYTGENEQLITQAVIFDVNTDGQNLKLTASHYPDGKIKISSVAVPKS